MIPEGASRDNKLGQDESQHHSRQKSYTWFIAQKFYVSICVKDGQHFLICVR